MTLDNQIILPLLNIWENLFYLKALYIFSSNVWIRSIDTFVPECLSYSSLVINLECACSGKNKQSKWSLFPIWTLEFHFSLECTLLHANRGFFILSFKKWIFFYQTNNLYICIVFSYVQLWDQPLWWACQWRGDVICHSLETETE